MRRLLSEKSGKKQQSSFGVEEGRARPGTSTTPAQTSIPQSSTNAFKYNRQSNHDDIENKGQLRAVSASSHRTQDSKGKSLSFNKAASHHPPLYSTNVYSSSTSMQTPSSCDRCAITPEQDTTTILKPPTVNASMRRLSPVPLRKQDRLNSNGAHSQSGPLDQMLSPVPLQPLHEESSYNHGKSDRARKAHLVDC